ncbi:MAG: 3' terminal RNA ribose 2'-O-methyltransferase Hen1 [Pseudomonadota bacterium]
MQIELTLEAGRDYPATDLGFLLHKHPGRAHQRETSAGVATVFFSEATEARATAVLHLDVDPIALVRGKGAKGDGPLAQYVNDRAYAASSFLSVALAKSFAQSLAGKSKDREALADRALPLAARITPLAVAGDQAMIEALFAPLGYTVEARRLDDAAATPDGAKMRRLFDIRLTGSVRLADLLSHLYVLTPVLDNAKHYWIDQDEVENLLSKGERWLAYHPAKDLIAARALKHRKTLINDALERLTTPEEQVADEDTEEAAEEVGGEEERGEDGARLSAPARERAIEAPMRLHELRLQTVLQLVKDLGVSSVLDLGCGEGRLLDKLKRAEGVSRIVGVDPSTVSLARAARRLRLDQAGEALRERLSLRLGSLTYGDRRWRGFDLACLVEVIEHIDPPRLSALTLSLFADARPRHVIVTTPNREYNALFETLPAGRFRHADHRFEWTRAEFAAWSDGVAAETGYSVERHPLGPEDETHGAPSQMAVFSRQDGAKPPVTDAADAPAKDAA